MNADPKQPGPYLPLAKGAWLGLLAGLAALAGCASFDRRAVSYETHAPAQIAYEPASFDDLDGWRMDDQAAAIPAFLRSCARLSSEADWRAPCEAARAVAPGEARGFFERYFRPVRVLSLRAPLTRRGRRAVSETGLFTGYYEPVYPASKTPTARFSAPVLARPDDLVMVDLGAFRDQLAGERIAGFVEHGRLVPYPDHRAINEGALGDRAVPIAYLDPNDLLFMQIQGSGRLVFEDGSSLRVGYDGQNGRPYFPVGKALIEEGALARDEVSMQSIRGVLSGAGPEAARRLRETNPSYVFFRAAPERADPALGPLGSDGVPLTPMRSLAVDRRFHALGAPVWIAIAESETGPAIRGLFIAQDTGGAIKGPLRGDIYFGSGEAAGEKAGRFRAEGTMTLLLPLPVAARLIAPEAP
ncbi:MAG: murein transglycosylase A [Amphiplicatus sp.]